MTFLRSTLALLAWLLISIPTGLFVVYVMVKVYFEQRRARPTVAAEQPT